ncbi:hypothetical protein [Haloarchaeobius sp. TZWSO28]|uniref:hypothetical protein n=1 Tax=Haloarchaeobius sp. TZWSO28 TaxID=3446119 RepID=UPI003EBBE475
MSDEFTPWEQRLKDGGGVDDPLEVYLTQINQVVYGDSVRKKALHAMLRLVFNSDDRPITKVAVAEEAGLSTTDLYNKSVFEVFSDFGLVYPIKKVHRDKGAYLTPDKILCRPLFETEPYGLMRTDVDEYERGRRLMCWFGSRLAEVDTVPVESGELSRPIEWQMEFVAIELGIEQPVDVTFGTVGMRAQGQSKQWRFIVTGTLEGDLTSADNGEVRDWLKRKMTAVTKASLTNHRVCCPCESLENHLVKVEQDQEQFIPEDKHYVAFEGDGDVKFETVLNKLKSGNGGD